MWKHSLKRTFTVYVYFGITPLLLNVFACFWSTPYPLHQSVHTFWMVPKIGAYFISKIKGSVGMLSLILHRLQKKNQKKKPLCLWKKRVIWRKIWKNNTFSAEECFLVKNTLIRTFLKKTNFTSLFKQTVHPFNKSYIDFLGSNNPKGGNHESNRAKEERKLP